MNSRKTFFSVFILGSLLSGNLFAADFTLSSKDFNDSQSIPVNFTCQGKDLPPTLLISNPPRGTKSMALVLNDPDATSGNWIHWIAYNIPSNTTVFPPNTDKQTIKQGLNSWGNTGYQGPCPPSGTHRYFFTLYALDTLLDIPAAPDENKLQAAMEKHILGKAILMGSFGKHPST